MTHDIETMASQLPPTNLMKTAEKIHVSHVPITTSNIQNIRTVATSMTTGNVSIRYIPRLIQFGSNMETTD